MLKYEKDYANLIADVLANGEVRQTRNGETKSVFGRHLVININGSNMFPILQGRKMYPKGVLGELAAMLRKPKHIKDFEEWGCNYWKLWAKEDGSIDVDYGNAWHADDQIIKLKDALRNNPTDRRMIINGWRPQRLDELDLPCCHLLYQFYVREGKYIDMIWYQRSVDTMIGLPSDIIFAAAWLIAIAKEFGFEPGTITMSLGDCHIYGEHYEAAADYVERVFTGDIGNNPKYVWAGPEGEDFCKFEPSWILLNNYKTYDRLDLELKA